MGKKRYTGEQIISKLREAEVLQSNDMSITEICRQLGIKDQTYYKWRKEYGAKKTNLRITLRFFILKWIY